MGHISGADQTSFSVFGVVLTGAYSTQESILIHDTYSTLVTEYACFRKGLDRLRKTRC